MIPLFRALYVLTGLVVRGRIILAGWWWVPPAPGVPSRARRYRARHRYRRTPGRHALGDFDAGAGQPYAWLAAVTA